MAAEEKSIEWRVAQRERKRQENAKPRVLQGLRQLREEWEEKELGLGKKNTT